MGYFVDEEIVCTNVCSDRTISDDKTVVDDDITKLSQVMAHLHNLT